jgi:HPt (histidine-containing phosphotransfer) domain-containing protein
MTTTRDQILDAERIDVLRKLEGDGNPGLVAQIVHLFVDGLPEQLEAIGAALRSGKPDQVRRIAHLLGGAAAGVGACRVRRLAADLEKWGKEPGGAPPFDLFETLRQECAVVAEELRPLAQGERP